MTREAESQLLDFCVQQRETFSSPDWLCFRSVKNEVLATAALFLAAVDWYGHREPLLALAEQLQKGCVGKLPEMVKRTGFSCGRFSNMMRARLRHEHAHIKARAEGAMGYYVGNPASVRMNLEEICRDLLMNS
jgi:hypothetical protein